LLWLLAARKKKLRPLRLLRLLSRHRPRPLLRLTLLLRQPLRPLLTLPLRPLRLPLRLLRLLLTPLRLLLLRLLRSNQHFMLEEPAFGPVFFSSVACAGGLSKPQALASSAWVPAFAGTTFPSFRRCGRKKTGHAGRFFVG
jgi:hypothetical protein